MLEARLIPAKESITIRYDTFTPESWPLIRAVLEFHFRTPLMHDRSLWSTDSRSYFLRKPRDKDFKLRSLRIDVYDGFTYSFVPYQGRICLCVDVSKRYLSANWLADSEVPVARGSRALYHYGDQWYAVEVQSASTHSIRDLRFKDRYTGQMTDVYTHTVNRWREELPEFVSRLNPNSHGLIFRTAGDGTDKYGALCLAKAILGTRDERVQQVHHHSILPPDVRLDRIQDVVKTHFSGATLNGAVGVQVSESPVSADRKVFAVPDHLFGNGHILKVGQQGVGLENLGRARRRVLEDPAVGLFTTTPFDSQYLIAPNSLGREIIRDLKSQFEQTMGRLTGQSYQTRLVTYDDSKSKAMNDQTTAVKNGLDSVQASSGYAFLVLPPGCNPKLHDAVKRLLWPHIQAQCASGDNIRSFYSASTKEDEERVAKRYSAYLRHAALGMLQINRKWPWVLATPLHYDVHVGIEVQNRKVGLTFVYGGGKEYLFRVAKSNHSEKLSARLLKTELYAALKEDLRAFGVHPRSIVFHRGGRSFPGEVYGIRLAMLELQKEGVLSQGCEWGVVELHRKSARGLRVFDGDSSRVNNPQIGTFSVINESSGVVCTTGTPFLRKGTASPVQVTMVEGALDVGLVLRDTFNLSHLAWSSPEMCSRLPVTLRLADQFLKPLAAQIDDELVQYGDDMADEDDDAGGEAESTSQDDATMAR
jgi:hypothetical protein